MVNLVSLDRVRERADHMALADHLIEGSGTVAPVERSGLSHLRKASLPTPRDTAGGPVGRRRRMDQGALPGSHGTIRKRPGPDSGSPVCRHLQPRQGSRPRFR